MENIANIITIKLVGLLFETWDATPFVKTCLRKNCSADDLRVKNGWEIWFQLSDYPEFFEIKYSQ